MRKRRIKNGYRAWEVREQSKYDFLLEDSNNFSLKHATIYYLDRYELSQEERRLYMKLHNDTLTRFDLYTILGVHGKRADYLFDRFDAIKRNLFPSKVWKESSTSEPSGKYPKRAKFCH